MGLSTKDVAFVAIFAALSVITIKIVPGIPIIGVPDASIKFDAALAPIYGLIAGPYLGFLAALIAGLMTAGSPFSVLTSFAPAVAALVTGLLTQRSYRNSESRLKGWMLAAFILGLLVLGWYFSWVGQRAPLYPILHLGGFFAIIITREWVAKAFKEGKTNYNERWQVKPAHILYGILIMVTGYIFTRPYLSDFWILSYFSIPFYFFGAILILYGVFGKGKGQFASAIVLASYCGIISDHMVGNLIFVLAIDVFIPLQIIEEYFLQPYGLPNVPSLFMYMLPVSIIERMIFTAIATIFGVGLTLALRKANLFPRKI
ncbi:MAG: ECF transporter S component [Candidatus Bathyarchaeia archaeon]